MRKMQMQKTNINSSLTKSKRPLPKLGVKGLEPFIAEYRQIKTPLKKQLKLLKTEEKIGMGITLRKKID